VGSSILCEVCKATCLGSVWKAICLAQMICHQPDGSGVVAHTAAGVPDCSVSPRALGVCKDKHSDMFPAPSAVQPYKAPPCAALVAVHPIVPRPWALIVVPWLLLGLREWLSVCKCVLAVSQQTPGQPCCQVGREVLRLLFYG